jgi:hypothetical protein
MHADAMVKQDTQVSVLPGGLAAALFLACSRSTVLLGPLLYGLAPFALKATELESITKRKYKKMHPFVVA